MLAISNSRMQYIWYMAGGFILPVLIVVVTHEMGFAREVAGTVLMMHKGKFIETGHIEGFNELDIEVVSALNRSERTSIVTCRVNCWQPNEIVQKLKERKIVVHKRQDLVRFSPHLYNCEADVDKAISELHSLLKG